MFLVLFKVIALCLIVIIGLFLVCGIGYTLWILYRMLFIRFTPPKLSIQLEVNHTSRRNERDAEYHVME